MPILAIDFGTSTTVAAVRADGSAPRLVAIDGSPLMPSSVFLTDNGTLTVGRDADRQARLDPSRYEPNPKRRIDDGEVMLGHSALPVVELVAAVLRRVAGEVARQFGSLPPDIRLTHPARWGRPRRQLLLDAARSAGLGTHPLLIPEPVAAATHYAQLAAQGLGPEAGVAVYDLGGGTFDVAVLRRSGPSWTVVAEAGLTDLGGVDFDQAIVEHIARRQGIAHQAEWQAMLAASDAVNRRLRRAFETDVRDCKEALSRYAQAEVPMSAPFHDELLTRAEFEDLIRDKLTRTVDLLAEQLRTGEGALSGVYLVGGSSRIPLVARLIQERLGLTPTTLDQPETSVATGALLIPVSTASGPVPIPQYGPPSGPVAHPGPPSGPVPQYGPPPYSPQPKPQPKRRARWLIPTAAVLVAVAVVAAVVLATRGHPKHNAGTGPSHSNSRTGDNSPSTAASTNTARNTTATEFDHYFPDSDIRDYMRPSYAMLDSCTAPQDGETFCQLKNGLTIGVGSGVLGARQQTLPGTSLVRSPHTSWRQQQWNKGEGEGRLRTWLSQDKPDKPLLYWDRNGSVYGILGVGKNSVTTTNAAALLSTWKANFER